MEYLCATQFRVFLCKRGLLSKQLIEVSYEHISSIELSRRRPHLKRLAGAVILFILGLFTLSLSAILFSILLWLLGIVLVVWFIKGIQGFTLHIVGRKPITIPKELSEMVKFVREKRRD